MMDWDHVKVLLALADAGSLRGAARALGIDQATAGRRLVALEAQLGTKLFVHTPSGYVVTAVGEAILPGARRMAAEALALGRRAAGTEAGLHGTVRIATGDGIARGLLMPALARLHARHPEIRTVLLTARTLVDIAHDEVDIAVRIVRPNDPELIVRRLGALTSRLYASVDYVARRGVPAPGGGFAGHDLILPYPAPAGPFHGEPIGAGRVVLETNSMLAAAEAAQQGLGIASLLEHLGDTDPSLVPLWPDRPQRHELWLVVHPDLARSARVRAVLDAIIEGWPAG
ncbi:transcriptional regulator [Aliidongia dinghuensis]|uniref:Transcriptional regulator n=1 Tax=Aliidongia dinghuensis TaxID=1867774 RepID=A0A8J2YWD7_9PROT|nr:LysR family transcriptional regulator [Aliidongia dinghuensis]GGF30347.1 transcriptional regulator [Aliidongia dinghuensis]